MSRFDWRGVRTLLLVTLGTLTLIIILLIVAFLALVKFSEVDNLVASERAPYGLVVAEVYEHHAWLSDVGYRIELFDPTALIWGATEAAYIYGANRNDCARGIDVSWRDSGMLAVSILDAEYVDVESSVNVGDNPITIRLREGVTNADAPCGPMQPLS